MEYIQEILGVIIVIAPLAIFITVMRIFRKALADQGVKIADLLIETDAPPKAVPQAQGGEPAADPPVKRSASRFILFLSGISSLVLASCITSYYFYMKIYSVGGSDGLDLADFTNVLLALGIGVVPYSVNQVKKIKL
ncbi:MAG: flagellar basal body-associated protein FliL [Cyclobacteriaceae bacterium]|jgi:flagellar basal body-associated protein FliL